MPLRIQRPLPFSLRNNKPKGMFVMPMVLVLGSALLHYFSFPNILILHGFYPLGWLFAIPFLFVLDGKSWRQRCWLGLLWGVVAYGLLVQWLCPITFAGYILFVLVLAVQAAIFAVLAVPLPSSTFRLFYYPSAWVLSEWLRTALMGGFTWSVAYSQSFHPHLIQASSFGGVYAVSWLMFFVNTAFFLSWKLGFKRDRYWIAACLVFLLNWALGVGVVIALSGQPADIVRISAVQANVSRENKIDPSLYEKNAAQHLVLTKKSFLAGYPDLVVWPETAFPDDILKDRAWQHKMEQVAKNYGIYFLIGSALLEDGQDLNSALLISPEGSWKDIYAKRHLVPFTEYRLKDPLSRKIFSSLGLRGYDFAVGTRVGIFSIEKEKKEQPFGVAICSEEGYPQLFRELAGKGAGFFVVMLNDGWFRAPEALLLHAEMGIFRAVEGHRPLVRVANTGWTVLFDSAGRAKEQATARIQEAGFAFFDVMPASGKTVYVRFGDFFVLGCLGFVIIMLLQRIYQKRQDHA
jgi:apolipoprotein N-acyltransferase